MITISPTQREYLAAKSARSLSSSLHLTPTRHRPCSRNTRVFASFDSRRSVYRRSSDLFTPDYGTVRLPTHHDTTHDRKPNHRQQGKAVNHRPLR